MGIIRSLTGMGNLAVAEGQFRRAAKLYAVNLRMRTALEQGDFEAAWGAGEAMSGQAAAGHALAE